MTPAAVIQSQGGRQPAVKCGARGRQTDRPCKRGAGWGTSHPGYGQCKVHGGTTPSGIKYAARLACADFARGMLGAEVDISAGDAQEMAVRLAAGVVTYYRIQLLGHTEGEVPETTMSGYERAIERLGRMSKLALDAGVDERRVRAMEHMTDRLVAAAEAGLGAMIAAGLAISSEHRTAFAREFAARLSPMEQPAIEGTASDAVA